MKTEKNIQIGVSILLIAIIAVSFYAYKISRANLVLKTEIESIKETPRSEEEADKNIFRPKIAIDESVCNIQDDAESVSMSGTFRTSNIRVLGEKIESVINSYKAVHFDSSFGPRYDTRILIDNRDTFSITAYAPVKIARDMFSEIEETLSGLDYVDNKFFSRIDARQIKSVCLTHVKQIQAYAFEESVYLKRLEDSALDAESIQKLSEQLNQIRQNAFDYQELITEETKTNLDRATISIEIQGFPG